MLVEHRLARTKRELIDRIAIDHMAGVPSSAGAIAGQAQRVLR